MCVNLGLTNVCLDTSSYLTVLHSLFKEVVQQQVLQLSVPVKRLFDFTQEDTVGREVGVHIRFTVECIKLNTKSSLSTLYLNDLQTTLCGFEEHGLSPHSVSSFFFSCDLQKSLRFHHKQSRITGLNCGKKILKNA